jgi:hypothetical protein
MRMLIPLLFLVGCPSAGVLKDGRFVDDKVQYKLGQPGTGWQQLEIEAANAAWHNPQLGAALLVNSHCEGVRDAPLEGLTDDLLIGMTEREIIDQQKLMISRREALETVATAKIDGVPRKLTIFVMKKDGCVYDIVLDAPQGTFEASRVAYARVRDGFDVEPRRDR